VEARLQAMSGQLAEDGETSLSLEYRQAYGKVLELLDKVVDLFGEGHVSVREWREILDTGFSEIRVGVIPACVDRVSAGDMRRTRLKDPRVLFFMGANDGLVPAAGEKASLLSDMDRRSLEKRGVRLAPTRQENGFIDRFYLYLTLTKPSERLYVSWCRQASDGSALSPSYLIGELKGIFPALAVERADEQVPLPEQIVTVETARSALLAGFAEYREGHASDAWKELYSLFLERPGGAEELGRKLDAVFLVYHEESMGPAVARVLYGENLSGSVTRLEQYAACAYAQFLTYGLQLAERRLHEFAAADMGILFHEVIQRFFARVYGKKAEDSERAANAEDAANKQSAENAEGLEDSESAENPESMGKVENAVPLPPDDERRRAIVHECLMEAARDGGSRGLEGTARGAFLLKRVERIADRTLWALCEQLARGDFRPSEVEVEFDGKDSSAMNLVIDEDTLMRLHGRIDRVDTCEDGDQVYVKVIDYKTGNTSLDLVGVYYGLQLQLVVYLDAAMERERGRRDGRRVVPAGILYYNIKNPFVAVEPSEAESPDEKAVDDALMKELKMNGIVNRSRAVYSRMDRLVGTDAPPVIPVVEKEGAPVERRSSVADTRQLEALCRFVREQMRRFGRRIMNGDLAVNPYMHGDKTGCDYCSFASVCGFDKKTPGYGYRSVDDLEPSDVWEKVSGKAPESPGAREGAGDTEPEPQNVRKKGE